MTPTQKFNPETESSDSPYGLHPDLLHFVTLALNEKDRGRVKDLVSEVHPADIAELNRLRQEIEVAAKKPKPRDE